MKTARLVAAFFALNFLDANATKPLPESTSSLSYEELSRREISHQLASVRSHHELRQHASTQGATSPLSTLSAGGRARFIQSLVFTEKGLASFDYSDLRSELTASQIFRILRLFGVEHATSSIPSLRVEQAIDSLLVSTFRIAIDPEIDYHGYACISKATCSYMQNSICIGDNC